MIGYLVCFAFHTAFYQMHQTTDCSYVPTTFSFAWVYTTSELTSKSAAEFGSGIRI